MSNVRSSMVRFCTEIGNDPLLVQGAGGNVSWKDGDTLWIKASGTWLVDAGTTDIFVPVDLADLRGAIDQRDFFAIPKLKFPSELRPSIETLLHALMPAPVVVHLHAIEVLAHLVRQNCNKEINSLLKGSIEYSIVEYFKPGAELAAAVHEVLVQNPTAKVIFLKNHGVVIGGPTVAEVGEILEGLVKVMQIQVVHQRSIPAPVSLSESYVPIDDEELHNLACNPQLYDRLNADWALYPDHLVFLGATAQLYQSWDEFQHAVLPENKLPELIFIKEAGVFAGKNIGKAKIVQLRCYYDVLVRQNSNINLASLSMTQIGDILNWDAEKYRMRFEKK